MISHVHVCSKIADPCIRDMFNAMLQEFAIIPTRLPRQSQIVALLACTAADTCIAHIGTMCRIQDENMCAVTANRHY